VTRGRNWDIAVALREQARHAIDEIETMSRQARAVRQAFREPPG
jgi:hypothetical protein